MRELEGTKGRNRSEKGASTLHINCEGRVQRTVDIRAQVQYYRHQFGTNLQSLKTRVNE